MRRFFTGFGIGGAYAAINFAIDELIPARVRGRVDLAISGSFWVGAALSAPVSLLFESRPRGSDPVGLRSRRQAAERLLGTYRSLLEAVGIAALEGDR